MEEDFKWKKTFDGQEPLMEEDRRWNYIYTARAIDHLVLFVATVVQAVKCIAQLSLLITLIKLSFGIIFNFLCFGNEASRDSYVGLLVCLSVFLSVCLDTSFKKV